MSLADIAAAIDAAGPAMQTSMSTIRDEKVLTTSFDAYKGNSIVYALIAARLQVFSQARFQWTRFTGGKPGDLFGSPELDLLENPWPGGTTADLLAAMEVDVSAAGNAYIWRNGGRLHRLRPECVTMVIGSQFDADIPSEAPDATLVNYVYQRPGGAPLVLDPSEVAHYAPMPDPKSVFLGMSWITPAIEDVGADNASTIHKRAFFQNAATPNLAFKFDPSVTIEQIEGFRDVIESGHTGAWNAYKTLYLGGGADPVVIGKDFRELEFSVTQGKGESRLAAAAGVPPSWVGFSEGLQGSALNAGNFTAARRRFGDGTMRHLWQSACSALEQILAKPGGASLWYSDRIAFFAEDAKDAADIQMQEASTITALVRDGFTPESAINAVDNSDWSLLEHTGMLSVQLQEPGAEQGDSGGAGEEPVGGEGQPPAGTDNP
ncbi:phage portal protein [Saccharopolyspora shandongensis]|uniref:phage portal protein n=1 Tax=Saccharopolyspora shandongensis TaxID=418495 RepID=UPI0033C91A7D